MKKAYSILLFLCLVLGFWNPSFVSAQDVQNFQIKSFEADYYLSRDSETKASRLLVQEKITAVFPNFDQNRGIFRVIPEVYNGNTVGLSDISVVDNQGRPFQFSESSQNDNRVLRIGDPNNYVRGEVTYNISYTLRNVISFQEFDEFYWDVNGTEWQQVFDQVIARVHIPAELAEKLIDQELCFAGFLGQTLQNCSVAQEQTDSGKVYVFSANSPLSSGQTLTFVLGFEKQTFELDPEIARAQRLAQIRMIAEIITFAVILVASIVYVIRHYIDVGRDPKSKSTIIPEYIPPKGLSVVGCDKILHESVRVAGVTAGIMELVVSRHLAIHETVTKKLLSRKTDFELEYLKPTDGQLPEQQKIMDAFFSGQAKPGDRVSLASKQNKLHSTTTSLNTILGEKLTTQGYFPEEPQKTQSRYLKRGMLMIVIALVATFTFSLAFIGLIIGGLLVVLTSSVMPSKTAQGVELRDYLKGLKMYMQLAEKDRLEFSHSAKNAERVQDAESDSEKIKLYERLLPYAVLFGIEQSWTKEFAHLYQQPPEWYRGSSGVFQGAMLGSALQSFSAQTTQAFSAPSSSSGSGFSGGSSGGGGGGGGGGGW